MQMFYMVIGKDALFLYEKEGIRYSRQYIEGNQEFHYQINTVKNDIKKLLAALVEEYNLNDDSEIAFTIIENSDSAVTEAVSNALDGHISNRHGLDSLISGIIKKVNSDKIPLVKEYGINFEEINYRLVNGILQETDYSLLGYTLQADDLIMCIG